MMHRAGILFLFALSVNAFGQQLPHPDHIVVVIEENKNFEDIIGSANAPYLNELAHRGALLTKSYGLHHPSQPNYLELFSGNQQGVCNDTCPRPIAAPNLASSLIAKHLPNPFVGYAESLPSPPTACSTPKIYGRKHCPWMDFDPPAPTKDFGQFPTNFSDLPTVAFVIPNLTHDMHNLPSGLSDTEKEVRDGDLWLKQHLDAYARWAVTHNSLLIITWDEDGSNYLPVKDDCEHPITTLPPHNHIATIIVGAKVIPGGTTAMTVTHYNVLRTIEDMEGLPPIGGSCSVPPIAGIWQ
jgi:phosphatidylinositol-3-phosphatase